MDNWTDLLALKIIFRVYNENFLHLYKRFLTWPPASLANTCIIQRHDLFFVVCLLFYYVSYFCGKCNVSCQHSLLDLFKVMIDKYVYIATGQTVSWKRAIAWFLEKSVSRYSTIYAIALHSWLFSLPSGLGTKVSIENDSVQKRSVQKRSVKQSSPAIIDSHYRHPSRET